MNGVLRPPISRIETAWLGPNQLTCRVVVSEFLGKQARPCEFPFEAQFAQLADRMRRKIDPNPDIANFACRLEQNDVVIARRMQAKRRGQAADTRPHDRDPHCTHLVRPQRTRTSEIRPWPHRSRRARPFDFGPAHRSAPNASSAWSAWT